MAYYAGDENEEGQNQGAQGAAPGGSGSGLIGNSGGGPAPGGGTAQNAPTEKAAGGASSSNPSPFVGIKEYLNANKPQAANLGNKIGGYVGGEVDAANQKLQGAQGAFGQDVDKNTVNFNQGLANEIKADPTAVANDQAKAGQVQNMQKAYQGPTDFQTSSYYGAVQPDLNKAQQAGQNLGNASGQKQVLTDYQQQTRGGRINNGAATLDQGLLSESKEAQANLQPAIAQSQKIPANLQAAIDQGLNKVNAAKATSAQTNQQLGDLFKNEFATQKQGLEKRASDQAALVSKLYGKEPLTADEYSKLGIDPATGQKAQALGINLGNYVGQNNGGFTGQSVATPEDYARSQALAQLSGTQPTYLTNKAASNGGLKFDTGGLKGALSASEAAQAKAAADQKAAQAAAEAEAARKRAQAELLASQKAAPARVGPTYSSALGNSDNGSI